LTALSANKMQRAGLGAIFRDADEDAVAGLRSTSGAAGAGAGVTASSGSGALRAPARADELPFRPAIEISGSGVSAALRRPV
jgi:hypothetical protein